MARTQLRILCFGDSLTSGYFSFGMGSHPYSIKLEDKLTGALPGVDVEVVTSGVPGDVATFERFSQRLRSQYEKYGGSFDWVIMLAGANDLAYGISPGQIYASLQKAWNIALSHGSRVLALTVPERESRAERLVNRSDRLNLSIMTHQQENYYFFDLQYHIPYHSLSQEDREKYWDDGLHLRDDGYDWMGEHIANGLLTILSREDDPSPPKPKSTKPVEQPEDILSFDEETGNSKNISEGYVVVRKRDLD